ncbi:MAG TPA: M1 family metallopeptidase, partial [Candidatus Acidoferrales bacterium]|nr:M1 family metallopeptidase [Candidatus Acidoferrales bacterium]
MSRFARTLALAALLAPLSLGSASVRAAETADVRLGHDVVPTFEAVHLRLDADRADYSGWVHVELNVASASSTIRFHADGPTLTRVTVVQHGDSIATQAGEGAEGLRTLTLAKSLEPGAATLDIAFTAPFGTRAVGLYRVTADERGYAFTQFESSDARRAFPCWDEPGFKIPWQVTLEVPVAHEAVSNTPIERTEPAGSWKTITFRRTRPLPSYLVAIATGPLEFVPVPGTHVPMRIVTVHGKTALAAVAAYDVPRLLAGLERWFGTPYPFEKLDLIAVPDFAYGAMENAGAITFREDALLIDPATATSTQRRSVANVSCHEMAHMWFGDLVTMSWWDDLWLNESFADWMAAKITDQVFPEMNEGLFDLERIQQVMAGDVLPSTIAIRAPATSATGGLTNVGLVYSKGNAMLSMFEAYLGPEVFRRGVQEYLKAHAWGNATASDLWRALDAASGSNVSAAMASFTDQPGVAEVRVVPAEGGVRLTQTRASPWGVSQAPMTWRIPMVLRYARGGRVDSVRVLLDGPEKIVALPGRGALDWVMPNAGGHGYYAWSEPDEIMARLSQRATDALSPAERVAFLGNLGLLFDDGEVHGDTYLAALVPFGSDRSPSVVASDLRLLGQARTDLVPDSLADPFAVYVRRTLGPELAKIGYERKPGEDETIGTIRGDLLRWLAHTGRDAAAERYALAAAKRYLADPASVDP